MAGLGIALKTVRSSIGRQISSPSENLINPLRNLSAAIGKSVRIDSQRQCWICVTQACSNIRQRFSGGKQRGRVCMTERMPTNLAEPGFDQQREKLS